MTLDTHRVKRAVLRERMLAMAATLTPPKTLNPAEVARAIAGSDAKVWRRLMKPMRDEAVRLARAGKVVILRRGKPVDPTDFRGVYRIRLLAPGEAPPVFEKSADVDDFDEDDDEE